jgi:hypothetical protein
MNNLEEIGLPRKVVLRKLTNKDIFDTIDTASIPYSLKTVNDCHVTINSKQVDYGEKKFIKP